MTNVVAVLKALLSDVAKLETPALATAVAAVLVPIIVAIAGVTVTAPELAGWLVVLGTIAAGLQKNASLKKAAARPPGPPPVLP